MPTNENFCHLHVHHQNSLLDSLGTSKDYAEKAKHFGMKYLAITDHGSISGIIDHQRQCDEHGLKPIFGTELYCVEDHLYRPAKGEKEKRGHLTIWVKNETGYTNLLKILSHSNIYGFYYRNRVGYDLLLDNCEGLIIGTACSGSFLNYGKGIEFFHRLREKVEEDIYLEIMPHDFPEQIEHNKLCYKLYKETGVPLIGSNDSHYLNQEDWDYHDTLLCIQSKKKKNDPDRWRFPCKTFHFCSVEEMLTGFKKQGIIPKNEIEKAILNTVEIAEKCNFRIVQRDVNLPLPPQYKNIGKSEDEILVELCNRGAIEKLGIDLDLVNLARENGLI